MAQAHPKQGFITGLPRSRTFWFAAYFDGLEGVRAYHEVLNGLKTKQQFYDAMELPEERHVINSDSGLFITDFQERWPDARTVIIHRDVKEVYDSLGTYLWEQGYEGLPSMDFLKDQYKKNCRLKGLHVDYESINEMLPTIHEYLVGVPHDPQYAAKMRSAIMQEENLTVDVKSYELWNAYEKAVGE